MTTADPSGQPNARTAVRHEDHIDYLDKGRLLHEAADHIEEHTIAVSERNPDLCDASHRAAAEPGHVHGPNCGHEAVPHGSHVDYLVNGRLQHQHGDHVDDHGPLQMA